MPTVAIVRGMWILFHPNDHPPPHFRAQGDDFVFRVSIADCAILDRRPGASPRERRIILDWTRAHRDELMENWHLARASAAEEDHVSYHRIARATPRLDHTVDIEWTDGSRSVLDMKPELELGGMCTDLREIGIFMHRMFIHSEGQSIGWEIFGHMLDYHADNIWRDTRQKREAAE